MRKPDVRMLCPVPALDDLKGLLERNLAVVDGIPLRGPMAINHLRQGSPVYVPPTWRFYKESELIHTVESRYS